MDSYEMSVIRNSNLRKEFRFTNRDVIELIKSNKGKSFIISVKAVSYVNGKYWSKKSFENDIKKINHLQEKY